MLAWQLSPRALKSCSKRQRKTDIKKAPWRRRITTAGGELYGKPRLLKAENELLWDLFGLAGRRGKYLAVYEKREKHAIR